jgi:ornithine cyclodeaminase/alanine dehydrogenase-like protein (mu-crystallin family)
VNSLLVLSEHDVERLLTMEECIEAMDEVLSSLARGELFQPLRFVVRPPGAPGLMGFMPGHRAGPGGAYSLKEIVVVPGNPAERGLDAHQGGVLLHDGETGQLRALLNASPITAIRTAAVSAVATRALARPGARRVAIVGRGVQGQAHAAAMRAVLDEPEIRIAGRDVAEIEAAVRAADVVCTCTTSREPVVRREWLAPGAHVNAVGASVPTSRELDEETIRAATVVVDRRESALAEAGELLVPGLGEEAIAAELGEVLTGAHPGRTADDELTVFKSLGLAVEDLAAAELVVRRARAEGAGVEVPF